MDAHERRALPEGWEWKRLGDVATVGAGNGAPQGEQYFIDGKYPFVRTQDVGREKGTICLGNTKDEINDLAVKDFNLKLWPAKTLLIPKSGESTFLNHRALLGKPSYVSSHLATIIPNNNLLPEYLYFWSLALDAKKLTHDINYPSLRLPELESAKIPLPPLPTQRRIVSILEKAEETTRLRAQADELTDRLLQSVFMEMFGDPVRNPKGWKKVTLGSLITTVEAGPSRKLNDEGRGPVNITSGEVQNGLFLSFKKIKYIDVSEDLTRYYLDRDDILLNYVNSLSQIGKSALYRGECYPAVLGHNIFRIKVDKNTVHPVYLTSCFKTEFFMNQIKTITKPAVNQASFNTKDLKKCMVLIPPLPLQQKFARIVEKIESMRQSQNQSKQQIEDLFSALMQKAFRGELEERKIQNLRELVQRIGSHRIEEKDTTQIIREMREKSYDL